jgi:hypothetical protein
MEVIAKLMKAGIERPHAYRILEIAERYGEKLHPIDGGVVAVTNVGGNRYTVDIRKGNSVRRNRPAQVAQSSDARYSSVSRNKGTAGTTKTALKQRSTTMARRAAVAEPEVEETDEAPDYTAYADKEITATMEDFHEWLEQEVGIKLDLRSVALGGTLRMEFQKSQFNKDRRAERQAARAAGNGAAEEAEPEAPAKPARRGRQAAAATSAKPGPAKGAGKATAATPGPSRRGGRRPAAAATTGEAPF